MISGAVLQAARKTASLTQERLAEALGADVATVKGWESGRRPLGRVQAARIGQMRRQLRRLGARPALLAYLNAAIDADAFVAQAVEGNCGHLGSEVTTRPWSSLVGWATRGVPPSEACGFAPPRPLLDAASRDAFFSSIREAVERAPGDEGHLLRHQAYYLAAGDASPSGAAWLVDARRTEARRLRLNGTWTPGWAVGRSLAVAEARQGDRDPLRWFIKHQLADPACDEANLIYWAYWIGIDPEPVSGEEFMMERRLSAQQATPLLHHLICNLSAGLPYAELSAETILSILRRWPGLLACDTGLARELGSRADHMLDAPADSGGRTRLSRLHAAARTALGDHRKEKA